jgi:hypothetical protein
MKTMTEQTTLFDVPVIDISTPDAFSTAVHENQLDDQTLVWANYRAFMASKSLYAIIPVDELTIIPNWKEHVNAEFIPTIEKSPSHNLFLKLYQGQVIDVAEHVNELLDYHEVTQLFNYLKK